MDTYARGRRIALAVAATAVLTLFTALSAPAHAAPGDDEGGTPQLRQALDEATRGFLDAQAKLEQSRKRQTELNAKLVSVEAQVAALGPQTVEIAKELYRTGGSLRTASALLSARSPNGLMDGAARLSALAMHNDRQLRNFQRLKADLTEAQNQLAAELTNQEQQLAAMAKRKADAERALAQAGGGQSASGPGGSSSARAQPAPRRPDGTWPPETCSVKDPSTSGCLTPRTLHAHNQARAAGFMNFRACYRSGGGGEHPKGRACDFAAQPGGFGGVAQGPDRVYGNNLAAYFLNNASRLGVLYVIWFRQIWLPSSGWKTYNGGNGDPASDHTNHLHLSVY